MFSTPGGGELHDLADSLMRIVKNTPNICMLSIWDFMCSFFVTVELITKTFVFRTGSLDIYVPKTTSVKAQQ